MALLICDWSFIATIAGGGWYLKLGSISEDQPHSLQSISFSINLQNNIPIQYDFGPVHSQYNMVLC